MALSGGVEVFGGGCDGFILFLRVDIFGKMGSSSLSMWRGMV